MPYNSLRNSHVQSDNVPGNSYDVKASGFPASGHPQNLRVVPGFAPKAKQHQIGLTKRKVVRPGTTIVEDIFIQKRVQLVQRNIKISSGFGFRIELFHWFERSSHNVSFRIPFLLGMRGSKTVVPWKIQLRYQVNCPKVVGMTPYPLSYSLLPK